MVLWKFLEKTAVSHEQKDKLQLSLLLWTRTGKRQHIFLSQMIRDTEFI